MLYHATITCFNSSELPIFNNLLQLKFFIIPIRMTDDPVDPNQQDDGDGGRRRPNFQGGGGRGLFSLLSLLLGYLRINWIIPLTSQ